MRKTFLTFFHGSYIYSEKKKRKGRQKRNSKNSRGSKKMKAKAERENATYAIFHLAGQ